VSSRWVGCCYVTSSDGVCVSSWYSTLFLSALLLITAWLLFHVNIHSVSDDFVCKHLVRRKSVALSSHRWCRESIDMSHLTVSCPSIASLSVCQRYLIWWQLHHYITPSPLLSILIPPSLPSPLYPSLLSPSPSHFHPSLLLLPLPLGFLWADFVARYCSLSDQWCLWAVDVVGDWNLQDWKMTDWKVTDWKMME